jgi:hypothetical protein
MDKNVTLPDVSHKRQIALSDSKRIFKKRVLRKIFGPEEDLRKTVHIEETMIFTAGQILLG